MLVAVYLFQGKKRENVFFLFCSRPKTSKQKKKGFVAFLFVSRQQAKAKFFCFFILVKTKKEQTLAGSERSCCFFFSVSSKRPIEKVNVFCFCFLFFLLLPCFYVCFFFSLLCQTNTPFFGEEKKRKNLKLKSFVVVCFHFLWVANIHATKR